MTPALPLLGFGLPVAGAWATPSNVRRVAQRAEALGYASLWAFQRVLYPVTSELPSTHRCVLDPIVALAYAAGHTERIRLGTATVCAPFTSPALLAKAMASLDVLSEGRLTVGIGMGWLPEEHEAAGISFERRGARFDEYLRCLLALWTEDPVSFSGEFYRVPDSHVGPRPQQQPHPPVLIGGTARRALERAGRRAQGWIASTGHDLARLGDSIEMVRVGARQAGKDPHALRIVVRGVPVLADDELGPSRRPLHGTRSQVVDDLVALRAIGVTEVFFDLNLSPLVAEASPGVRPAVDAASDLLEALNPADLDRELERRPHTEV